jgi:RNA polymerase sigma-70 factor (ECF subfamily)
MENTDKSLIDAHCQGDGTAFAEIVRRYGQGVFGYLMRMSGSREQAEDLVQETFRRVHEKAHTFRGERFKSWLFAIATRAAIDNLRRHSRLRFVSLNRTVDCDDGACEQLNAVAVAEGCYEPSEEAAMAERKEQVRQAIKMLPARQRATLVLAYYQQLSYREVAEVLGCSIGTVKTQMSRALRTLAQRLPDISGEVK